MGRSLLLRMFAHSTVIILCSLAFNGGVAQSSDSGDIVNAGALVAKAPTLIYPAIARMAHVTGDVALVVRIRKDGSVESVVVAGGPALLRQAAVDNARASQFDCGACSEPVTQYSLVYTFQLADTDVCPDTKPPAGSKPYPQVVRSPGHVTIVDQDIMICDPAAEISKVRSIKCLFLWKCAYHRF